MLKTGTKVRGDYRTESFTGTITAASWNTDPMMRTAQFDVLLDAPIWVYGCRRESIHIEAGRHDDVFTNGLGTWIVAA